MPALPPPAGNVHVALQVWDIGGQNIGGKMIGNYIYGAQAVLLVYDITNYKSFQDLEDWYRLVLQSPVKPQFLALVGNKMDLNHMRSVRQERHTAFADENEMHSFFVSAKSGDGVNTVFFTLASELTGVPLTRNQMDGEVAPMAATIVEHQRHDLSVEPIPERIGVDTEEAARGGKRRCSIQ
jgi:Ras-related protein Rab-28